MIYSYDLTGAVQLKRSIPLFGNATNIKAGAAVQRGATDGTNQAYGVIAASTLNNFIGVTESLFAAATLDNDPATGLKYLLTDCTINPFGVWECEYDQTTGLTVASVQGGTGVTITSGETIGGGWLLGVGAPGLGLLAYVDSSSGGAYTLKTPTGNPWTTASKLIKIMHLYAPKVALTTDATKILGTTAGQGSWLVRVLENKVVAVGFDHQFLDPTKHDNITFATGFKFFAMINFTASIFLNAN